MLRRGRVAPETERLLARFLELQIAELEDRRRAADASASRQAVRAAVGQKITHLALLLGYAVGLGIVSWSLVLGALVDPQGIAEHVQRVGATSRLVLAVVPDALRGLVISTLTTLLLLVVRGASFSLRMDAGGALFVGGAVLSLVGISAAAYAGPLAVAAAAVGFVAAVLVVHEFCDLLMRQRSVPPPDAAGMRRLRAALAAVAATVRPSRSLWLSIAFVAVPTLCVLVTVAAGFTLGGPLFVPARIALFAFVGWAAWACAVTPTAIRIPLWSVLPWSLLLLTLFWFTPVAFVLGIGTSILLFANVMVFTLRPARYGSGR